MAKEKIQKQKSIKNFDADDLRQLIEKSLDAEKNIAVIPIDNFREIYKGKTNTDNFKNFTSSIRNAVNTLLSIDNNKSIKEIKDADVYSRNKMFAIINKNLLQ